MERIARFSQATKSMVESLVQDEKNKQTNMCMPGTLDLKNGHLGM